MLVIQLKISLLYCFKDIVVGGLVRKRMEQQDFSKGPTP